MLKWTHGVLFHTKFHIDRSTVPLLKGEKCQTWLYFQIQQTLMAPPSRQKVESECTTTRLLSYFKSVLVCNEYLLVLKWIFNDFTFIFPINCQKLIILSSNPSSVINQCLFQTYRYIKHFKHENVVINFWQIWPADYKAYCLVLWQSNSNFTHNSQRSSLYTYVGLPSLLLVSVCDLHTMNIHVTS